MMELSISNINQRAQGNDKKGTKREGKQTETKKTNGTSPIIFS